MYRLCEYEDRKVKRCTAGVSVLRGVIDSIGRIGRSESRRPALCQSEPRIQWHCLERGWPAVFATVSSYSCNSSRQTRAPASLHGHGQGERPVPQVEPTKASGARLICGAEGIVALGRSSCLKLHPLGRKETEFVLRASDILCAESFQTSASHLPMRFAGFARGLELSFDRRYTKSKVDGFVELSIGKHPVAERTHV